MFTHMYVYRQVHIHTHTTVHAFHKYLGCISKVSKSEKYTTTATPHSSLEPVGFRNISNSRNRLEGEDCYFVKSRTFSNPNPCQRWKGEGVFLIPASMQCQVKVRNVTRSKTDFSPALTMSSHTCNLLSHRGITYEHPRDTAPSLSTVGACCACRVWFSLFGEVLLWAIIWSIIRQSYVFQQEIWAVWANPK